MAVFPAAGLGTRFLPATKVQPKEMLPLVDRPLIQYVVEEAREAGIERIVIVTGRGKTAIEDHFDTTPELEALLQERGKKDLLGEVREVSELMPLSYVRQKQALGLGHAVLQARDLVGDQSFAVMLCDDIVDASEPCIGQMIRLYEKRGNPVIALQEVPRAETRQYGIVSTESQSGTVQRVTGIIEKPKPEEAPTTQAVVGRYILTPRIFHHLRTMPPGAGGEIQLTDAIARLLAEERVIAYQFDGRRYDCGSKLGYLEATVDFGLKHPETADAFAKFLTTRWGSAFTTP